MFDVALHSIELCAGVGMLGEGLRAGLEFLGVDHRTVCYVEREAPAAAQLVALMEAGALDAAPVWSDLLTFRGEHWRGKVDCIVAGFPCQDISIAGRRAGLDGKRSGLFFDILDIAERCELKIHLDSTSIERYPQYPMPDGGDRNEYLRRLTQEGLERRFGLGKPGTPEFDDRAAQMIDPVRADRRRKPAIGGFGHLGGFVIADGDESLREKAKRLAVIRPEAARKLEQGEGFIRLAIAEMVGG